MKVLIYSAKAFEIPFLEKANRNKHQIKFIEDRLNSKTAVKAVGYDAVSIFSADEACFLTIEKLKEFGIKYIALRSVGYDNVNLNAASRLGIKVANVPDYSPFAISEHAVSLILTLNRKIVESNERVKRYNFNLDGLVGVDLNGKTIGIIGTGRIGSVMAKIMNGFGCKLLGYDLSEDQNLIEKYQLEYTSLTNLCERSDIITIHVPLNSDTHYLLNEDLLSLMKSNVIIINTARGAIIKTEDVIDALKNNNIGALGIDVYENERGVFFKDRSQEVPDELMLMQLNAYPNVLITGHHAYLTHEALTRIAEMTFYNLNQWEKGIVSENELTDTSD
ncbi:2-hydroxyacid dehydrogenase [Winogradskyella vincentii]|uniref:2-hydroxyacid dehydrogenase n=1 Tax=Winogradskyella vincentii TaxID=2877122 RepID=A0ABS7Y6D5_9FLAO|nr:2-hydroxyacid dehydrogenase [Winogradskyella vincentii]MCA0154243.1 2-hydroxyacid dehydrogenase [Winogradskyella vincentii]